MEITRQHVESVIRNYVDTFVAGNRAATLVAQHLDRAGVGLWPVIDHITFRTLEAGERAREFEALGFAVDDRLGVVERDQFWYKVYRRPGFPAVVVQQAYDDARGSSSPIPAWVERHTDSLPHHLAILVDRLDRAVVALRDDGLQFIGEPVGDSNSEYRQVYTIPEMVDDQPFTVLELVERRWGFAGFLPTPVPDPTPPRPE